MVRVLVRRACEYEALLVPDLASFLHAAETPRTIEAERKAKGQKIPSHPRPCGANYCSGLPLAPVSWAAFSTDLPAAGPCALRHVDVFGLFRDDPFWHPEDGGGVAWA